MDSGAFCGALGGMMASRNSVANVARYHEKKRLAGKCRTCDRPRMVGKNGRPSPYCEIHRARATQRELDRLAKLRAAGEPRPTPASKSWVMHLAHPADAMHTACGTLRDSINCIHIAGVTCANCKRTAVYRIALESGPPAGPGDMAGNVRPAISPSNGNGAVDKLTEDNRRAALMGRRCAACRAPLSAERLIAEIEFCAECQPAGMI